MLILHVLVSILTLTSALHVPNTSEESIENTRDWHDRSNSQGEINSAKYASSPRATNRKQFTKEESVKTVTPDSHEYIPGPRSQSLTNPINQNSAYGGSSSPSYQVKSYENTDRFSTPYFGNTFGNSVSIKPTTQLKIIAPSHIEKLQQANSNSEETGFSQKQSLPGFASLNYEYPFYTRPSNNNQKEVSSSNVHVPIYKTQYSGPKNSEYVFNYAPSHQSESNFGSALGSNEKLSQYFPQNDVSTTVGASNKKIALPVVQASNSPDIRGYLRAFESQPILLNHNLNYQPSLNFDLASHRQIAQPNNISPFQSPISSFQGQVIPIQTAGSTPQFPQYKGAAVAAYPANSFELMKIPPRTYQPLHTQPQLHFQSVNSAPQLVKPYQNTILRPKPAEEIREDVEIIKKKPPPSPPKKDDDDFDDGYKSVEAEYGPNSGDEDDYRPGKYFKESSTEGDFKPSKSFPFKEYDEKFGKYSNKANSKDEEEGKPYSKYQSYSSAENDEDEDARSSKYNTDYESSEPHRTSYDDEDEEETQKYERQGVPEEDSDHKDDSKRNKYYGRSFEKEYDDFYKKPLAKNKYIRTKDAPEVEHSHSNYKSPKSYRTNERGFDSHKEESEATSNSGYYVPSLANTKARSISNEKVLRDLTGI